MMAHVRPLRGLAGSSLAPLLDILFVVVLMMFLSLAASLIHMNEPPKGDQMDRSDTTPAAIFVQVSWDDGEPHDVDTYLRCTEYLVGKEVITEVNFRQKHSGFLDLFPDDLGKPSFENYERTMSNSMRDRLLPNTLCQLNVHLWSAHSGELPIDGEFHVILNKDDPVKEVRLTDKKGSKYSLSIPGEEVTLAQLVINDVGEIYTEASALYPETAHQCMATCK